MIPRVELIIFNKDNNILFGKNPKNGHYMLPGGKIGFNESPVESSRIKCREKAGINIISPSIVGDSPFIDELHDESTIFVTGKPRGMVDSENKLLELQYADRDSFANLLRQTNENTDFKDLVEARIQAVNRAYNERFNVKKGSLRPRVEVLIFDKDKNIFIGKNPRWNNWALPGGGIDENESPLEAAKREAAEESGMSIKPIKLLSKEPVIFNFPEPKNGYTGSATYFVLAKRTGGLPSKQLGADNDALLDGRFENPTEASNLLISTERSKEINRGRIQTINKAFSEMPKSGNYFILDQSGMFKVASELGNAKIIDFFDPYCIAVTEDDIDNCQYHPNLEHIIKYVYNLPHMEYFVPEINKKWEPMGFGVGSIIAGIFKGMFGCPDDDGLMHRTLLGRFIRHSPLPNCYVDLNGIIRSFKEVEPGEELTINRLLVDKPIQDCGYEIDICEELPIVENKEKFIHKIMVIDDEPDSLQDVILKESCNALLSRNSSYIGKKGSIEKKGSVVATAGQILLNSVLPKELQDYSRLMDAKGLTKLLENVAEKYPEKYTEISDKIRYLGDDASVFHIRHLQYDDLKSPVEVQPFLDKAKKEYESILKRNGGNKDFALVDAYSSVKKLLNQEVLAQGAKQKNLYSIMAISKARGKPDQITDMLVGPLLVGDYKNKPIPVIIDNSYAQGLTPAQDFAASYGTRKGMISTKLATPKGGYFSKMMGWSSGNIVVTESDCKTQNGVNYSIDDKWNNGKYLAKQTGRYEGGTYITPEIISDLKNQGIKEIVVRSPITCESPQGICQKCLGKTEVGKVAPIGYNAGLNASAAISEPVSQSMLSEKHTGGAVKARVGGYDLIKQLVSIPGSFENKSVLSKFNGTVDKIEKQPWGGWKIYVNGKEHYTNEESKPTVTEGTKVEKGFSMSQGFPNPAEVAQLRGIGDARKSVSSSLRSAYEEMGLDMDRSHYETISRALVNFGEAKTTIGSLFPGDIGRLDYMKSNVLYNDVKEQNVKDVDTNGVYIARQIMYYFPGTEITESIKKNLLDNGYEKVYTTKEPPKFNPVMIRAEDTEKYDPDWIQRLGSQGLKRSLLEGVQKSHTSNTESSTNFVHPYVYGMTFGKRNIY